MLNFEVGGCDRTDRMTCGSADYAELELGAPRGAADPCPLSIAIPICISTCGASLFRCSAAESEGLAGFQAFTLHAHEHALAASASAPLRRDMTARHAAKDAHSTGSVQGHTSGSVDCGARFPSPHTPILTYPQTPTHPLPPSRPVQVYQLFPWTLDIPCWILDIRPPCKVCPQRPQRRGDRSSCGV
jgi:hypothetical protein